MPDRIRARAAVAVVLIVVTMAGVSAAGPAIDTRLPGRPVILVVAAAAEVVAAVLLLGLFWRRGPAARAGAADGHDIGVLLRRILSRVLVALLVAIPLAVLISEVSPLHRVRRARPAPGAGRNRVHRVHLHPGTGVSVDLTLIRDIVLVLLLLLAVVVTGILLWLRRRRTLRMPRPQVSDDDLAAAPGEDLARAVRSGRLAIRDLDDARAAIIACYAAMEESLAEAGATRSIAETPDELLGRAARDGLVAVAPARTLTGLFYEARYSSHPVPAASRDQAERALAEIAASLPEHLSETAG